MFRFVFILAVLTSIVGSNFASSEFNRYWLDDYSGLIINLNCTETEAGTLDLSSADGHYPDSSFRTYITTHPSECPGVNHLYLNIRKLSLNVDDRLTIYDNFVLTEPEPVKILDGGFHASYQNTTCNSSSVSQLVTKTGQISIEFQRESSDDDPPERSNELVIDYTIIHDAVDDFQRDDYIFCESLKGFIQRRHVCDTSERVSCPTEYYSSSASDNPARGKSQQKLCRGFVATMEVAAIVILVLGGIFCICAALLWYYCYRKSKEKSMSESRVSYGAIGLAGCSETSPSQPRSVRRTVGGISFRHGSWTKSPLNGPPVISL